MEKNMPIINETFINNRGDIFNNIREIRYEEEKSYGGFGKLIGESGGDSECLGGVYVFRNTIDSSKVYRIYKDYKFYKHFSHRDEYFISELREYGKDIKLSDLPTGVITMEGHTIGQEVPFVEGITLKEYSKEESKSILPTKIYIQILNILKELYLNKIYYLDIHERNFLINNGIVKIIDFEDNFVRLGNISTSDKLLMFDYLRLMLNELNNNFGIDYNFERIDGIDDAYEKVLKLEENLIKIGYNK